MRRRPGRLDSPVGPDEGWLPEPDEATVAAMSGFVLERWRERARETGLPGPVDLSGSCRFSSLFVQGLHGGRIRGNLHHFHVRTDGGRIIDLNAAAADVEALRGGGRDPYSHHRSFVASRDVRDSFDTCRPRVDRWIALWRSLRAGRDESSVDPSRPVIRVDAGMA